MCRGARPASTATSGTAIWSAALAQSRGFSLSQPISELSEANLNALLYGTKGERIPIRHVSKRGGRVHEYKVEYEGVIPNLERRFKETESDFIRQDIEQYMAKRPCPACKGARLKPEALSVTIAGRAIDETTQMSVVIVARLLHARLKSYGRSPRWQGQRVQRRRASRTSGCLTLTEREQTIARQVLKEIRARLGFLVDVGLDYLTLDRTAGTLSGGEAQRIRLATQIGSGLMGVLYILDEPSIGLHQRDNARLIKTLERLRDVGNTLIVVEHDEETIRAADHVIDIGPGAGEHGGRGGRGGHAGRCHRRVRVPDRPVPQRPAFGAGARDASAGQRQVDHDRGRTREQPEGRRRHVPARDIRDNHGRLRLGQEHTGARSACTRRWRRRFTGRATGLACTIGSLASSTWTR